MTNRLYKAAITSYVPGTPYIPSTPGRPARPARTVYETRRVCSWGRVTSDAASDEGLAQGTGYSCRDERVAIKYPAEEAVPAQPGQAYTPAQILTDLNVGWTGGARSIPALALAGDGYIAFTIPRTATGVFVGLNDSDNGAEYLEIDYAIYVANGVIRVFERGVEKAYLGTLGAFDSFKIRRRRGTVTYLKNDVVVYTSSTLSQGVMFMDTSLYTAGDYVDAPAVVEEFGGESYGAFLPLDGIAADAPYAISRGSFHPLTGTSRVGSRSHGVFSPLRGLGGNRVYGASATQFQPLEGRSYGGLIQPMFGLSAGHLAPLGGTSYVLTGEIGGVSAAFAPLVGLGADRIYGASSGAFQPLRGYAHDLEGPNAAFLYAGVSVRASVEPQLIALAVIQSNAQITGLITYERVADGDVLSEAAVESIFSMQALLDAGIFSHASGVSLSRDRDNAADVWVVSLNGMGSTRYEGYDFNSFAEIDGVFYGARADGIYRLDGETDAGAPVQAMVSLGKSDFGTRFLKRISTAYMGVSSTGRVFLRTTVEGNTYTYVTRRTTEHLEAQRVDMGQGLRATYYEFEIYNDDGADFELATVEFEVVQLSRRI